jgi:hypothetical protein
LLFAFVYYRKISRTMWLFFLFDFALLILYSVGTECLHFGYVAALQWFKTTIWLRYFSIAAIIVLLDRNIPFLKNRYLKYFSYSIIGVVSILGVISIICYPQKNPWGAKFDFGQQKTTDPLIVCCLKAKELTPKDALFIQPQYSSEFKYYSQRSSYVDFKANVRAPLQVINWYSRLQEVYGVKAIKNYPDKKVMDESKLMIINYTNWLRKVYNICSRTLNIKVICLFYIRMNSTKYWF